MTNLSRDLLIAQACEAARNKYASPHTNQAIANLLAFLLEKQSPSFPIYSSAGDYEYADKWIKELASKVDDVVFNSLRDADVTVSRTIVSDAIHDNGLDLIGAGESIVENAMEDA